MEPPGEPEGLVPSEPFREWAGRMYQDLCNQALVGGVTLRLRPPRGDLCSWWLCTSARRSVLRSRHEPARQPLFELEALG